MMSRKSADPATPKQERGRKSISVISPAVVKVSRFSLIPLFYVAWYLLYPAKLSAEKDSLFILCFILSGCWESATLLFTFVKLLLPVLH